MLVLFVTLQPTPQVAFLKEFKNMQECTTYMHKIATKETESKLGCMQIIRQDKTGKEI